MQPIINQTENRLFSIDFLKAISITAVVSFHSIFVPESTYKSASHLTELLFAPLRFCVPVLLAISFLLLERGLEKLPADKSVYPLLRKRLIRLAIPTVFWFSIAAITMRLLDKSSPTQLMIFALQGRIFRGAYYLLILLQFVPIFILFNRWFTVKKHVLLTVLLQCVALLLTQASLFGIFGPHIPSILRTIGRSLFVYWFVYVAIGAYLSNNWSILKRISARIPIQLKILLLSGTCLFTVIEYRWLLSLTDNRIIPFEYAMFSCVLSVLVWFLCFAAIEEHQLSNSIKEVVQLLAKYSLGIFCINGILSYVFSEFGHHLVREATFSFSEVLLMKFVGWFLLLTGSLGLSIMLDKVGLKACVR